jgi:hypothetical protein
MVAPLVEYRGSLIFGEVYIVHGSGDVAEATYRNWIRPGDAPRRGVGMIGDGSHSIPFSRCAIGFVGGAGTGNGGASMQTVTLRRSDDLIQNLGDLSRDEIADVLWKVETDRADYHFAWITLNYLDLEIEDFGEERLRVFEAPSPDGPWSLVEMQMRMPDRNAVKLDVPSFTGPKYFALAVVDVPSTDELLECILGVRPATALHDINGDGFVDTADVVTNLQN